MAKGRLVMNHGKWRDIIGNSPEIYGVCDRAGASLATSLGSHFTHDTIYGLHRVHTRVKTVGIAGYRHELKTHDLLRAHPHIG